MSNKPIILDNAMVRAGESKKRFFYDFKKDINVIYLNGKTIPFIQFGKSDDESVTITRVMRESDDEGYSLLETVTKTFEKRERDDEEQYFLETKTLTEVERERDDEALSLLEMMTKTAEERERDDEENFIIN